jgi:hypothetical protein
MPRKARGVFSASVNIDIVSTTYVSITTKKTVNISRIFVNYADVTVYVRL